MSDLVKEAMQVIVRIRALMYALDDREDGEALDEDEAVELLFCAEEVLRKMVETTAPDAAPEMRTQLEAVFLDAHDRRLREGGPPVDPSLLRFGGEDLPF